MKTEISKSPNGFTTNWRDWVTPQTAPGNFKLLSVSSDAKTVKGQKQGFMTAVMYLAPYKLAGVNVCPFAHVANCYLGCLGISSGHFGMAKDGRKVAPYGLEMFDNAPQWAKIKRTRLYAEDRAFFIERLKAEIAAFVRKAERAGLVPVVRLNGTSDLDWSTKANGQIIQAFPDVQFYDYTKVIKRAYQDWPKNYHLSLSYSAADEQYADATFEAFNKTRINLVAVIRKKATVKSLTDNMPGLFINGDETDLRFTDKAGRVVLLAAKGDAKKDQSGFVLNSWWRA